MRRQEEILDYETRYNWKYIKIVEMRPLREGESASIEALFMMHKFVD